jgi:ubiquinone/menaquinone biosynthesis C-methylase UbiE
MKMSTMEKVFVNSPSHSTRVSEHAETLLQQIEFMAGQKYLDVGCGNGAAPIHLAKRYHLDVTGVDVDPAQIQAAEKRCAGIDNARFYALDGTRLPFSDGEFDIVATNKVMHHVPEWQSAFAEMLRVLSPGGYLLYSDLVYPKWLAATGNAYARQRAGFPTRDELEALVASHQLQQIYFTSSLAHVEAIFQK